MRNSLRFARIAVASIALLAAIDTARGDGFDQNHYILGCDDYCPGMTGPIAVGSSVNVRSIDASFTGSWYDPAQSGQGLSFEVLPNKGVVAFWFTFSPDGTRQAWFVGNGSYKGNVATFDSVMMPTGGKWIPHFDPAQLYENAWGTMRITFSDADHGRLDFASSLGYGQGSMSLVRLTSPQPITTSALSASGRPWIPTSGPHVAGGLGESVTLLADGRVLVAGGYSPTTGGVLSRAELYDPANGMWATTGSMNGPRTGHTATLLPDGRVLVVGGCIEGDGVWPDSSDGILGTAELFDPATGRWTPTGTLGKARLFHTATLLASGKVLVTGGVNNGEMPLSTELYDPVTGVWTSAGNLSDTRIYHTASLLADGRVLVTGGFEEDLPATPLPTTELYDPTTGRWSAAAPIQLARGLHTATTLQNGDVLVAGGYDARKMFAEAEVYDPSSGSWTVVGSMAASRAGHSASLLPDGTVLVAAGGDGNMAQAAIGNSEIYDPAAMTWSSGGSFDPMLAGRTAAQLQNGNVLLIGDEGPPDARISAEIFQSAPLTASAGASGTWYDPAQSGHGLVIESLPGNQLLAEWFAFDPSGTQQSWFLGIGTVSGNTATIAAVDRPTGGRFIPNFDASEIVHNPWGSLTLTFTDCDHGKVDFTSTSGYGSGSMNLTRLTRPAGVVCP